MSKIERMKSLRRRSSVSGSESVTPPCSPSVEEFLAEENGALRRAGCKLAEAALHVAREHDGVHRLMLAVAEWATAVANEGGRGKANSVISGVDDTDDSLRCYRCGNIETPPYADGDTCCMCGGTFHPSNTNISG